MSKSTTVNEYGFTPFANGKCQSLLQSTSMGSHWYKHRIGANVWIVQTSGQYKLRASTNVMLRWITNQRESMRVTRLGGLRVIVNEIPLNLEKTTALVLSEFVLIYESNYLSSIFWIMFSLKLCSKVLKVYR